MFEIENKQQTELTEEVVVYPNPTNSSFSVINTKQSIIENISVYSITGECVLAYKPAHETFEVMIDSKLGIGIYLLEIKTKENSYSQRLVVK